MTPARMTAEREQLFREAFNWLTSEELAEVWAELDAVRAEREMCTTSHNAQTIHVLNLEKERDNLICEKRGLQASVAAVVEENQILREEIDSAKHKSRLMSAQVHEDLIKERDAALKRVEKLESIKACAKQIANTWWEFGPEVGFGEEIDHLERALAQDVREVTVQPTTYIDTPCIDSQGKPIQVSEDVSDKEEK